jgi:hypothetical protein
MSHNQPVTGRDSFTCYQDSITDPSVKPVASRYPRLLLYAPNGSPVMLLRVLERAVVLQLSWYESQSICTVIREMEIEAVLEISENGFLERSDNWAETEGPQCHYSDLCMRRSRSDWGGSHCIPPHGPAFPINHTIKGPSALLLLGWNNQHSYSPHIRQAP